MTLDQDAIERHRLHLVARQKQCDSGDNAFRDLAKILTDDLGRPIQSAAARQQLIDDDKRRTWLADRDFKLRGAL